MKIFVLFLYFFLKNYKLQVLTSTRVRFGVPSPSLGVQSSLLCIQIKVFLTLCTFLLLNLTTLVFFILTWQRSLWHSIAALNQLQKFLETSLTAIWSHTALWSWICFDPVQIREKTGKIDTLLLTRDNFDFHSLLFFKERD